MDAVPAPSTPSAAELLAGLAAAVAGAGLVALFVWATDFWPLDPAAAGIGWVWAAGMVGVALAGYAAQRRLPPVRARWTVAVLAGLAAGLVMAPLWAGLHGTPQPPFGVLRGDMTFRTEYITRFASTWRLDDYTFGHLRAFYPPAWFWLAGRTAHVLDLEPWRIVKPFTIGTVGVALALAYVLWRRVLTPAGALAAAIGSSLVLTRQDGALGRAGHATQGWYSPYSCLVAVVGVAWLAAAATAVREGASRRGWVLIGLLGALLALCYYLLFIILAAVLVALAVTPAGARRAAVGRAAALLAAVAALTAFFWVPLLADVLGGAAAQGHYLAPDFLQVQLGFDGPADLIVLAVAAVVALTLGLAWPAGRAIVGLLVGTVVWQLLSVTSLVLSDNQLQPHRAVTMLWATLGAAVPVALEGMVRPGSLGRALPVPTARWATTVVGVVAAGATLVLGARQGTDLATGPLTVGAQEPIDMRTPAAMSRFITTTTGRAPQDLTLLSGEKSAVLVTRPYQGFLALGARYAHPRARLAQRVAVVERAAACATPACTTRALTATPFGAVDAVILTRSSTGGEELIAQVDDFPDPRDVPIAFRTGSFEPATWARREWRGEVVYARRQAAATGSASTRPRGVRTQTPTLVSTRDSEVGRSGSSSRARSGRSARTPRSS